MLFPQPPIPRSIPRLAAALGAGVDQVKKALTLVCLLMKRPILILHILQSRIAPVSYSLAELFKVDPRRCGGAVPMLFPTFRSWLWL